MSLPELCLLAVALAMDCFTVSIVCGVILRRLWPRVLFQIAVLFGLFQALMPFAGWMGCSLFSRQLETIGHWIAFGLLVFIGGRMVWSSVKGDGGAESRHFNPASLRTQLLLAVATSIDALAVGVSLTFIGYPTLASLTLPLSIIGLASFLLSVVGHLLGVRYGTPISRRVQPELLGGIVLIGIGFRILLS